MYCHLCSQSFDDLEAFKLHIVEHGHSTKKEIISDESEPENAVVPKKVGRRGRPPSTIPRKKKSLLKKRIQKKKRVIFGKKVLPNRKRFVPPPKQLENDFDYSDDNHSKDSFKGNDIQETVPNTDSAQNNSQVFLNNNLAVNTNSLSNNPVFVINPFSGQGVNNFPIGNSSVQQPYIVVNPTAIKPSASKSGKCFNFTSKNILNWLEKHREICKGMKFPLPSSLFDQVKTVHKAIFDRYCTGSIGEETTAVMKVYEELDCMIHKHINSINNDL